MERNLSVFSELSSEVAHYTLNSALSNLLHGAIQMQPTLKQVEGKAVRHIIIRLTIQKLKIWIQTYLLRAPI